jgi:predicted nucleic acid-binding protein
MDDNFEFLDSNIWIYAFSSNFDAKKHSLANQLIEKSDIKISTQIIGEVCNTVLRKTRASESIIRELINSFFDRFDPIEIRDRNQMLRASALRERYNFSHWDSLIVLAALETNCSILYSEDMHDGLIIDGTLTIQNPFIGT